ncbi:hypothetical protein HYPSUDRAFT_211193 [Hypholoma sublateritium FD-334 SS-4]|uniref:F-box domain-containing protein n=1 Tax=Hypholoma sublateritium (strain FD-334 SS-4) TaxID=945553 RepID=A0A0D2PEV4_HYPSF|nr:hypothetical protein HYPSUDRAFT_211193 [Hypholoma sublateritium FD-334 SS-4]
MSSFKSTLTSTGATLHALRSLTLNGLFFPYFSAQAPNVERLEINACVELPSLEMLHSIFREFPQLRTLIIRDVEQIAFDDSDIDTARQNSLEGASDAELARLYPSTNLRALAISLRHLEMGAFLYLPKIMSNLEYVEIANPREIFVTALDVTENQNSAVYQCHGLRNLKKLRLFLANNSVWNEASFIISLPQGIDLEIDHPPLGSRITVMDILNSKKFRSITIILAEESLSSVFLVCKAFSQCVLAVKPTLGCPTTLILPANETVEPRAIDVLGAYLTVKGSRESVLANGLIDHGLIDDFEEDDYGYDDQREDQWDYDSYLEYDGLYLDHWHDGSESD